MKTNVGWDQCPVLHSFGTMVPTENWYLTAFRSPKAIWRHSKIARSLLLLAFPFVPTPLLADDFVAQFQNWTSEKSGIDFVHTDGSQGGHYIMETVTGSLALFDFDLDGLTDIYFLNGAPLPGCKLDTTPTNRFYKNLGNMRFTDLTAATGLGDPKYAMGVVVGDVNNDGFPDVFVSNFGENAFFLNQGDGTFSDRTIEFGLKVGERFGAGNVFFDFDSDGDLDLLAASYVDFKLSDHRVRHINGHAFSLGPRDFPPGTHYLFENDGQGAFLDVSQSSGIQQHRSTGMTAFAADLDEDGDQDIFLANDQMANSLFLNDGKGRFQEAAVLAGLAFDRNGRANGNMGLDYVDLNGDQKLDIITTTYQEEMPVYYECVAPGLFSDSTNLAKIEPALFQHVTWGVGGIDFDNDSDKDLFFACGHFLPNLHLIDDRTKVKVKNFLLENNGRGKFENVTSKAGTAMQVVESTRAAGFDDLDNDGDIDFVVLNVNAQPTIGVNLLIQSPTKESLNSRQRNNALAIHVELIGTTSNRNGAGAIVESVSKGQKQRQAVLLGRGYESHYGTRLHFGLDKSPCEGLVVQWQTGKQEIFPCTGINMKLIEGQGKEQKRK